MGKPGLPEFDHETCVAYYAGVLRPAYAARVRVWLETHPDAARRARLDAAHDRAIAGACADVLDKPIPHRLQIERVPARRVWSRRVGLAAAVALSATGGWWLGSSQRSVDSPATFAARVVSVVQQDKRSRTNVALHGRLADIQAPDLSMRGYRLTGRRLLHSVGHPMAVFVYRNRRGETVSIYAENERVQRSPEPVVTLKGGVSLVRWRQGQTRYALVGDLSDMSLQRLAQAARVSPERGKRLWAGGDVRDRPQLAESGGGVMARQSVPVDKHLMPAAVGNTEAPQPSHM